MIVKVNDVKVTFNNNEDPAFIKKIKTAIRNNYFLISSYYKNFCGNNRTIDLSQDREWFDRKFYELMDATYNNKEVQAEMQSEGSLIMPYIYALMKRIRISESSIIDSSADINEEILSGLIAYNFFKVKGTFKEFVEYQKVRNREEEIYKWLQQTARWDTYNYLLEIITNYFKYFDEDTIKYMYSLCDTWINRSMNDYNQKPVTSQQFSKISEHEFDILFHKFLEYINAPSEWANIYNELKNNGLISYKNTAKNKVSKCYLDDNGIWRISICSENNITRFYDVVHEFIHYIVIKNGYTSKQKVVVEFPSIFFEIIAAEFLEENGYSNEITKKIRYDRNSHNYRLIGKYGTLLEEICEYANQGKIDKNTKIKIGQMFLEAAKKIDKETFKKPFGVKDQDIIDYLKGSIEETVDSTCDIHTTLLLTEGTHIINVYADLLGFYLAEQLLSKRDKDNTIIEKMIGIISNTSKLNINDIITLFGIGNEEQEPVRN